MNIFADKIHLEVAKIKAENKRLQDAKRKALQIADERSMQNVALREQLVKAEEERDSLQQVFDLQWEAYQRAIKRWQEANPGNDLVWPDSADMVVWLMQHYAKAPHSSASGTSK